MYRKDLFKRLKIVIISGAVGATLITTSVLALPGLMTNSSVESSDSAETDIVDAPEEENNQPAESEDTEDINFTYVTYEGDDYTFVAPEIAAETLVGNSADYEDLSDAYDDEEDVEHPEEENDADREEDSDIGSEEDGDDVPPAEDDEDTGDDGDDGDDDNTGDDGDDNDGDDTGDDGDDGDNNGNEQPPTSGGPGESVVVAPPRPPVQPPAAPRPPVGPVPPAVVPPGTGHPVTPPNISNNFAHSPDFIGLENRIRFNVESEIEGLPSFITMEMIIGALIAQDEEGFPASVTIAQIIQEGGYGRFGPGGTEGQGLSWLSFHYNNLFGIKGTGSAGRVNLPTFEMTPTGETFFIDDYFRVYNTVTEAIEDRTQLLLEVYSDLTYGVTNANEFAWAIGRRWATDINYAQSLVRHMENYDLYRLDEMTLLDYHNMVGMGQFIHPVPGSVLTSPFGWRDWDNAFHQGIDLGTGAHNLPIYAAYSGTVVYVGYASCAGNWVMINHGGGLVTRYLHNLANFVEVGQTVSRGQQIGLTGSTGNSTGNHLHFEIIRNGIPINPTPFVGL
ncbi:MAG: peptidoglycan DD-metalloendopeptidase family protein [Lachnospiraceae bacterium]|nr:peptidoglycan DD-metalloendopeptidase family protein [Lachnospiraceae bacterium]